MRWEYLRGPAAGQGTQIRPATDHEDARRRAHRGAPIVANALLTTKSGETGSDGVRVELALDHGRLVTVAPAPGPKPGAEVGVRLTGGVSFTR